MRDRGVPRDIGHVTQYHYKPRMSDHEEKPTTRLQMHVEITPIGDSNEIASYAGANLKPSDDVPGDEECLNIRQDCMTRDIRWDSIRYDSKRRIFEESGERINSSTENDPDGTLPVSHWICTIAVTGILCFVNQTPFEGYSKKQTALETATHGEEQLSVDTNDHVHIHDHLCLP